MEEPPIAGKENEKKPKSRFMGKLFKEKEKKLAMDNNVDDFLHGPQDKAPLMPASAGHPPPLSRIDTINARRWPTAAEIQHTRRTRGRSASPKRSKKGLAVRFTDNQPEVIGEGGDEATTPVSEIGARRRAHSHPVGSHPTPDQVLLPAKASDSVDGPGTFDDFRPGPLRRTQTGYESISEQSGTAGSVSGTSSDILKPMLPSDGVLKGQPFDPTSFAARVKADMRSGEGKALVSVAAYSPENNQLKPDSLGFDSDLTPQLDELRINTMRNSYISTPPTAPGPRQAADSQTPTPSATQKSTPVSVVLESPAPLSRASTLQGAAIALVEDALEDFSRRVAHLFTLFRLSTESVKPLPQCSLEELVRAALWWFLKGRMNLEARVRERPASPQGQKTRLFALQQAYADLAKSLWIAEKVTPQRPEVMDRSAVSDSNSSLTSVLEARQSIISNLRKLTMSMKRNGFLPPDADDAPLPQGLDNSIWIVGEGSHSLAASQRPSGIVALLDAFPLGDSNQNFHFGRVFIEGILEEEAASQHYRCPVVMSLVRAQKEKELSAIVASQDGLLKLCIQKDRTQGPTWDDVSWQPKYNSLKVGLPRSFVLRLHCSEQDFRTIWGIYDYQAKVHASLIQRRDESVIFEAIIKSFKYIDPNPESRFPKEALPNCYLRVFEKVLVEKTGSGTRSMHRGFRLALNTSPKTKGLRGIDQDIPPNQPLEFGFLRGEDGQPAILLNFVTPKTRYRIVMTFGETSERARLHQLLTGTALGGGEDVVAEASMKAFAIASYSAIEKDSPCLKTLDWQGFRVINEDNGDIQDSKTVLSDHLRVAIDFKTGSLTDRINIEPGELKIRLDVKSSKQLKVFRRPQQDMTLSVVESQVSQELPHELTELLQTIAKSPSTRTYLFPGLQELHLFQSAITGFVVLYDGMATSFNIARRRMVVPIYKKWDAASTRIQVVQREKLVQLVAFFENFNHGDCMNFALKSTDTFESSSRGGKYTLRIVDAKFALPKAYREGEEAVGHEFVCLDMPEYPGEHDDITIVFDTETGSESQIPTTHNISAAKSLHAQASGPTRRTFWSIKQFGNPYLTRFKISRAPCKLQQTDGEPRRIATSSATLPRSTTEPRPAKAHNVFLGTSFRSRHHPSSDVTTSLDANAMEKLESNYQAIQEHRDDRVARRENHGAITTSAEWRASWQTARCDTGIERVSNTSTFPPYSPFQTWSRTKDMSPPLRRQRRWFNTFGYILGIFSLWIIPATAVFIDFENCLSQSVQNEGPLLQLQFVPYFVDAVFNTTDPSHNLQLTVYGNVTGSGPEPTSRRVLPPWNDTLYWNSNQTDLGGKFENIPDPTADFPKFTTLFNKVDVLTYEPYNNTVNFCDQLVNTPCPLSPNFSLNLSSPYELPAFGFSNNFYSSYAFTSFTATLLIKYGDPDATSVGCISANVTPDLGSGLGAILTFIPLVVLIFVGIATAFAAVFSPWGTTDTFRWTSNYGRDEDLLRLVTPGFGDCLQYIQFVVLTGGLTLNYPGFYQPIVSKVAWSALMFNQSFVSVGPGIDSVVDGMYVTHGDYGLDRLRQLVGMLNVDDVWAGMAVWLLVIIGIVLAFIQLGFLFRWIHRHVNNTQEEDLRAKNMPFSVGNVIRIVFNYFLLPIVALSMFQLVVASNSPAFTVALAVVMLALIVGFAIWLLYLIASTRPKSYLFDDLPTVLLYGSLYNTYSDNAASFALIPVLLTFVRGVAIGAVQPSGIAQLALLAICEVIFILTLHAFRPFHSPTSMNAFHTFFSFVRLAIVLLMISFAPSLGVTDGPKGWIGYAILLMHAIVLICGFLLNAIQTIVEVAARMAGAGGDESGAARGGLVKVFGMRQLSRRLPRRDAAISRQSQLSSAAMLDSENDRKAYIMDGGRLRSQSAGSAGVLLNRQSTGLDSIAIDAYGAMPPHHIGSGASSHTPTTPGEASTFSFLPSAAAPSGLGRNRGPIIGLTQAETADPYYRPPRFRRPTIDAYSPGARSRGSWASGDWVAKRWSQPESGAVEAAEEGPSISGRATPVPQPPLDGSPEPRRSKADYTTREVDFYYGVRGPALNANVPSRRIKTGPADPTGPAASAAGWFKGLFGGKTKEKGKGFEVVRSSRMPPGMKRPGQESPPEGVPVATGGIRNGPIDSDTESVRPRPRSDTGTTAPESAHEDDNLVSPIESGEDDDEDYDDGDFEIHRISDIPPTLPGIELPGGGIELPSRFPSKATSKASSRRAKPTDAPLVPGLPTRLPSRKPSVPRKSSRRKSQNADLAQPSAHLLSQHKAQGSLDSSRLPFERSNSHNRQSTISTNSSMVTPDPGHSRTPSSVLGNFSADFRDDRPTSVGFVNHHSIQTINQIENPDFLGTSAEVVDGRNSGASSMEHPRH
ncbi:hypothetical protein G7Y89_g1045 [Cudoniella acicularis]|uniref:ML-like domain-containing protein n=1 Tax=Cudoniella acicularis TaxID=354080 RepID=A0A8H4RWV4_9HELO|nr:hypothetical protein G7Y89_g1045 [Cudoniella acicularis]